MSAQPSTRPVLALCGGIGGAKLALGLYRTVAPGSLTVVVNTGDDFEHLGLAISPDLDTVLYTLGGVADPVRGWGRADETWNFVELLRRTGTESWFQLGDRDLPMHVLRTHWLRSGRTLTEFAATVAAQFGIAANILPMSDAPVRTMVDTDEGELAFQHYFVRRQCAPAVRAISFAGAAQATMSPDMLARLRDPSLQAIVICPSNPYLSVDPILAVPGMVDALKAAPAPVIAVSPLVGGQAVKGPTAKIMAELGVAATPGAIAAHYRGLLSGLVVDTVDAGSIAGIDVPVHVVNTLMRDAADKERLAGDVLAFAAQLASGPHQRHVAGGRR